MNPLCILTGNIYRDKFYFEGKTYYNYYIDCGSCGVEEVIYLKNRKKAKTIAKEIGWVTLENKWYCPNCNLNKGG